MKIATATFLAVVWLLAAAASLRPDFDAARAAIYHATNLIYQRFEFHKRLQYQFFLGSMNFNNRTWDILKYKMALKMLHHEHKNFTMIFGGSSVTAGEFAVVL